MNESCKMGDICAAVDSAEYKNGKVSISLKVLNTPGGSLLKTFSEFYIIPHGSGRLSKENLIEDYHFMGCVLADESSFDEATPIKFV